MSEVIEAGPDNVGMPLDNHLSAKVDSLEYQLEQVRDILKNYWEYGEDPTDLNIAVAIDALSKIDKVLSDE